MAIISPVRLPSPYPQVDSGDWNSYQILQNFQFLASQVTALRKVLGGGTWSNPMTTLGDTMIGGTAGLPTRLAIGTAGQVLAVVSGSPAWAAPTPLVNILTTVTYSTSMTPNAALGRFQRITATDGVAFTINAPTNPLTGLPLTFLIRNTSGGPLGAVTWDTVFKLATWTSPATANSRSISFVYDGTNWVEYARTTTDVPN